MNKKELQEFCDDIQGELEETIEQKDNFVLNIRKAMTEISNFCEECGSHECCPEEECVLWRIEQLLLEEENKNGKQN